MLANNIFSSSEGIQTFKLTESHLFPGGAANTANNVSGLGGRATLIGCIGYDQEGSYLIRYLKRHVNFLFMKVAGFPTTTKTRIYNEEEVPYFRLDREEQLILREDQERELLFLVDQTLETASCVILSDYNKGLLNKKTLRHIINSTTEKNVPVIVDPQKKDFNEYRGAMLITPTLSEFNLATGAHVETLQDIYSAIKNYN